METSIGIENANRETNPSLGSEVFDVEGSKVSVGWSKFTPENQEIVDSTRAVIFLPGWPLQAKSKATWDLPRYLSNEFGLTTYNIDTVTGKIDPHALELEARGIRDFIAQRLTGVKELTIFGHSEGTIRATNLAAILEKENPQVKINGVVLANPMGLYPQNFLELTKNFVITEPQIEAQETNPAVPHMSQLEFILELAKGIGQDIQATKLKYPAMFLAQMEQMRRIDPALAKLQAPVVVLTTDQDFVSNYRKYLPEEEIKKRTAQPKPEEEVREWILKSEKWEHLPEEERAKFSSQEKFVDDYLKKFRTREVMAKTSRARREYLKEHHLPHAAAGGFLLATRFGSHIGIPVERFKQSAYVVSRIFDRLKRPASK